jgi:hypothetical protein
MTPTAIFVLLLMVIAPNTGGASQALVEHHLEFKSRADCERFRDAVTRTWKGDDQPMAWGLCVEKPL